MSVVCKFELISKTLNKDFSDEDYNIKMQAVYEETPLNNSENAKFSKWTPWGDLEFGCSNPAALEQLEEGQEYYIHITPANKK